jgi:hypothetical protein
MVALGSRVYLSCTTHERLVDNHCFIVPIQHHLTMLEGDDDVWDEVRVRSWRWIFFGLTDGVTEFHEVPYAHVC